ncbi:MAG TPA: anhydro-N-acetylmuramic acid kinase [Candidatus Acidoferrum sp.]|nr:anhydro-N-acetylmuramic acid kinase [Candidatus Acidoferrum sp.]
MKKSITILGLNSGTSADGLDLAALQFAPGRSGAVISFLAGHSVKYPGEIKSAIERVIQAKQAGVDDMVYLDAMLGKFYGRSASQFIRTLNRKRITVDAVASHGQTVRHLPHPVRRGSYRLRGTLQLGSLDQIAFETKKITVGNFRQADIACGHEGAPITVAAMARLFADNRESRLIVNVGGMANFFYFPSKRSGRRILAADTGPGNSLSDLLMHKLYHKPYDRGGKIAASGTVSKRLLTTLLAHPFFTGHSVSTGREQFGSALVERIVRSGRHLDLSNADILATAVELTALGIVRTATILSRRDHTLTKLYLTGGGVHNHYIVRRLDELLPNLKIDSVATLGFDPDLVEASAYAVMGYACLRSEPLPTDFRPGSHQNIQPILGHIAQPPVEMKR